MADRTQILTGEVVVIWDAITKPEEKEGGGISHGLTVAIHPDSPHLAELEALYEECLRTSEWKGKMPKDGNKPIGEIDEEKIPELAGWLKFAAGTRRGCPAVFDKNNADLSPMKFARSFYAGAKVELLVDAYAYNNKKKGIAFGLSGIKILDTNPSTAPTLSVSGGISVEDARSAFGGGSAPSASGAFTMTDTATNTREEYHEAGWSDQDIIDAGHMVATKVKPTPPAPKAKPTPPAPKAKPMPPAPKAKPSAPTKPNTGILAGAAAHTMTDAATFTYEEYVDAGYTDAMLIEQELMVAPAARKSGPPPPGAGKPKPPPPKPKGPTLTDEAAAEGTYQEYIDLGWDDDGLRAAGMLVE